MVTVQKKQLILLTAVSRINEICLGNTYRQISHDCSRNSLTTSKIMVYSSVMAPWFSHGDGVPWYHSHP